MLFKDKNYQNINFYQTYFHITYTCFQYTTGFIYNIEVFYSCYRRFRYLAYRSFVSWCWGYLGRSVRVVIPSCVVNRIRLQFPDPAGQYVGFRPPLDWIVTHGGQSPLLWRVFQTVMTEKVEWGLRAALPHMAWGPRRLYVSEGS